MIWLWSPVARRPSPVARRPDRLEALATQLSAERGIEVFAIPMDLSVLGADGRGTTRFGADPASSVLDRNCKAHELDNLYVVDISFFVSANALNPTLTAVANATRVGDHLIERLA